MSIPADRLFITVGEAAELLMLDERTVRRGIEAADLPGFKVGATYRIPWERFRSETGIAVECAEVETRRRRKRLTDETLQLVAEVYRDAHNSGEPPTSAVAEHFHKSHSTAARWVQQARERSFLGKANGTRGGEA